MGVGRRIGCGCGEGEGDGVKVSGREVWGGGRGRGSLWLGVFLGVHSAGLLSPHVQRECR